MAVPTIVALEKLLERVRGVFFCYALPALDKEKDEFTEQAGSNFLPRRR